MKRHAYGLGILGALLLGSLTSPAAEPDTEVRFKLYRGYTIVVQGSIGSLNKLNFLIDTGAVPSVLDQRIARKLRLVGKEESVSVFSGSLRALRVEVADVQLGPIRAAVHLRPRAAPSHTWQIARCVSHPA